MRIATYQFQGRGQVGRVSAAEYLDAPDFQVHRDAAATVMAVAVRRIGKVQ